MNSTEEYQQIYPYMNKDFFQKLLYSYLQEDCVDVSKLSIVPGLRKGQNFASNILRATVWYSRNSRYVVESTVFILKVNVLDDQITADLINETAVFPREITVYKDVMPELEKILNSIGDNTKIYPRCIDTNQDLSYLVFEDLKPGGYVSIPRKIGLDYAHMKIVLNKLAKWHAASAVLLDQNSAYCDDTFLEPVKHENSTIFKMMMCNTMQLLFDITERKPRYKRLHEQVKQHKDDIYNKICQSLFRDDNEFNVLCHGDLWSNNIMFKYDKEDNVIDGLIIDFQTVSWNTPGVDVAFLLFTSSHESLTESDWNDLIKYYLDELINVLEKLRYAGRTPSMADLQCQINKKRFYLALFAIFTYGSRHTDSSDGEADSRYMSPTKENCQFRVDALMRPRCQSGLEFLLNYFEKHGHFE